MASSFVRQQEVDRGAPLLQNLPHSQSVVSVLDAGEYRNGDGRRVLDMRNSDVWFRVANPILQMGLDIGKTMTEADIFEVLPDDVARKAHADLELAWNARKRSGKPDLKRSMNDCWHKLAHCGSLFHLLEILNGFISPIVIKNMVKYVESEDKNILWGLFLATLFFLAPLSQSLLSSHFILRTRRVGIRCYSASACMIFDKTLRLSQASASKYGAGAIVNIAQVDSGRFDQAVFFANFLWSMPLQLLIALSLLFFYLGPSALTPLIAMFLMMPVNNYVVKKMMTLSRNTNKLRDARVKVLTEVVHAVRLIKMLGWEEQVSRMVGEKRLVEMQNIGRLMLFGVGNILIWQAMPALLPLLAFGPYVAMGGNMDPSIVFSSLSLLDSIRTPLTLFPQAISILSQVQVGVERIEKLLLAEEMEECSALEAQSRDLSMPTFVRDSEDNAQDSANPDIVASAYNAEFRWSKHSETKDEGANQAADVSRPSRARECFERFRRRQQADRPHSLVDEEAATSFATVVPPSLRLDSLEIHRGEFVLVVGAVGAGKSTLLAGLLNEVPMDTGTVTIRGSVAYCNQVPWIMQGTVKDNILMGTAYDEERFQTVIDKCALVTDLAELKDGKDTLIGERGINLSGGQKARIGLARACYADAAVYMLDDPLSAVDMHVAKHLVSHCFGSRRGLLREKTRILVTHQLQYMDKADMMVVIQNGKIAAARPPSQFTNKELEDFGLGASLEQERASIRRQKSGEAEALEKEKEEEAEKKKAGKKDSQEVPPPRQEEEEREIGALSCSVWCAYARAMGYQLAIALLCVYFGKNLADVGATYFLSTWSNKKDEAVSDSIKDLCVYASLSVTGVFFLASRVLVFRHVSLKVSRIYHDKAMWAILRVPMSFLETTPTGRIINRFSSDLQKVDMDLRYSAAGFIDQMISMVFALMVSAAYVPFIVLIAPLLFVYNYVQRVFRTTARELQRLLSRSKSPIFAGLDEAITGVSSIRAFQRQKYFIQRNHENVEANARIMMSTMCCNRWLSIRLRAIGTIPVAIITYSLVLQKFMSLSFMTFTGAAAGFVLRFALQLTTGMEGILQSLTGVELCLVALERVSGYSNLLPEDALTKVEDHALDVWPSSGSIEFQDVVMRYRDGLPTVLNGISFKIAGGTSVGVVGRTGAGKSSLLQALFRMCPLDAGTVRIDGVDVSAVGLHTLRRRLAIIPQDPVGFTGSFRFNLDPFYEHSDNDIKAELENVQLLEFVSSQEEGLAYHLTAGGENLSVGQRQLMCAARAFLRKSSILVLDEATASVDFRTDELIQTVLRQAVVTRKLTTLTIAHRINTIMGSDNVMVMDKGRVAEFGPTHDLADDPRSIFYTFAHPNSSKDEQQGDSTK